MKMWKVLMRVASVLICLVMFIVTGCTSNAADTMGSDSVMSGVESSVVVETSEAVETEAPVVESSTASSSTVETSPVTEEITEIETVEKVLIQQTEDDINVIPDKYNTGAKGTLTAVELGDTVKGIAFRDAGDDTRNILDFAYRNKGISGTVVFENYDFSNYDVWAYNEDKVDRKIHVIFNNCKFRDFIVGKTDSNLSYEFNQCTISRFGGSNAKFDKCKFGAGSYTDALVPYRNVEVNNSFFADMGGVSASGKEIHTDGTQIYGYEGLDVQNVYYTNCRFEIPPLSIEESSASINACIMLQLEYSNAKNVAFVDCIANGGGYTLYAWDKNKGYTFTDVEFDGIQIGCAKAFGTIYPVVDSSIAISNVFETDALYIASVWKEAGKTYFSVSNDTNQDRTLVIYTSKGMYEYMIPACPTGEEIVAGMTYAEMPFDLEIVVPEDCEYAICYDHTLKGNAKQIRFENWSGEQVYLDGTIIEDLTLGEDIVILSGMCGKNVEYTLTQNGVLTLTGTGATDNYHSTKLTPWNDYSGVIRKVKVESGITELGTMLFRKCAAIETVSLPNSLEIIGKRAFAGCTSLTSITIPAGVHTIGDAVFSGSLINKIYYDGTDWSTITLGSGNEDLASMVEYINEVSAEVTYVVVMSGSCGENVEYVLTDQGTLLITGTGQMDNYHSGNTAPWHDVKESIVSVVVGAGVETIGNQAFRKCSNITEITLPNSIVLIGSNALNSCKLLTEMVIPKSVKEIAKYAFAGIPDIAIKYCGTEEEWNQIVIGSNNESIEGAVSFN